MINTMTLTSCSTSLSHVPHLKDGDNNNNYNTIGL